MHRLLFAIAMMLLPVAAQADVQAILTEAAALCAEQDNGTFGAEGAVVQVDVSGDGEIDTIVDEGRFTCTTAASLFGGSGGSMIHVFVGGTQSAFLVQGYEVLGWAGSTILLLALHGADCGGIGADPCFEALVWNGARFMTVRAAQP